MLINRLINAHISYSRKQFQIPLEHKDEFIREVLKTNYHRENILSFVLVGIDIMLIGIDTFTTYILGWNSHVFLGINYIHFLLILVPFIFLIFNYIKVRVPRLNLDQFKIPHILINFSVLLLCSSIGVLNELTNQQPFAYIVALFSIASVIVLNTYERVLIFVVTDIIFIVQIISAPMDTAPMLTAIFFSIILNVVALVVSYINYNAYLGNFILKKIIVGEKQELNEMYNIVEDTLKKRTDELNKALEYENLRTAFFANLSHELRTPLNIIYSAQQMLDISLAGSQNPDINLEVHKYTHMIRQNCHRLIRLIGNLIDITKIDAGYFKVNLINCDIVGIVEDITLSAANYIKSMSLDLIFDTAVEEKIVACDPDKIERIILNLLSNAVKFTPAGGEIYVNIYEREGKVIISVKDTGIGIPAEMKDLIFERFVQVDKTTTRDKEGSGIGLSIVKSLVQMHGGSLWVISEQGNGSEFVVEIPDRTVADAQYNEKHNLIKDDRRIEKINVEFSDIYDE